MIALVALFTPTLPKELLPPGFFNKHSPNFLTYLNGKKFQIDGVIKAY